jgi:hypothetical protein
MSVLAMFIVSLLGALAISLCAVELRGWIPLFCRWCVNAAVRRLPSSRRERYLEEWSAHVDDLLDRPITAILWAVGTRHAAGKVRREVSRGASESVGSRRRQPRPAWRYRAASRYYWWVQRAYERSTGRHPSERIMRKAWRIQDKLASQSDRWEKTDDEH